MVAVVVFIAVLFFVVGVLVMATRERSSEVGGGEMLSPSVVALETRLALMRVERDATRAMVDDIVGREIRGVVVDYDDNGVS